MIRTSDPKDIAILYLVTAFGFFLAGGAMALLIRGELAAPGMQFLSTEQYNQLFTMHGTIMLLLYATPILFGFANYILPLQIGAPDVAFPRLNAFSYWLFLFGGLIVLSGFLTPGGAADSGWFAYAPLSGPVHSPGAGQDLWIVGLIVSGLGTILGAVNMITTVVCMRAPGMTMFRMPIFVWNIFVTSLLILIAFPVLTALLADRHLGGHVFDPANGGAILYQHLFWFFGSSVGAFVLGASTLPFIWNVFKSYRYGRVVTVDDPWGFGNSLEWATSCPPPRHNFTELPRIRSERPAFELHYPHLVEQTRSEAHSGRAAAWGGAPSERLAQRAGRENQPDDDPRSR
ncbi:MAG: cbb3-type cytochrome c oxidase subunit I [Pseudonocardia sp.]|uniref:Cbb3-type cytochrome c oxidase subunit I n=1 Tax=Pseudonocardia abyssalis TaxID=2792008 RepID=A0ABS6V0P2_9PSEU|nr:cbb3-type cytochrome c oxidase subunit I [Pseudonocardia abyssalis]MBW0115133.1 cbb3-type cytochrome c oxidase subunit I [Pseudonocardia abyssalis]MBW0137972.1 cbb3-type cytochrome c oxidase subunit I [Pseudonocardia abyssalis]